jgi:hypothetical protein
MKLHRRTWANGMLLCRCLTVTLATVTLVAVTRKRTLYLYRSYVSAVISVLRTALLCVYWQQLLSKHLKAD